MGGVSIASLSFRGRKEKKEREKESKLLLRETFLPCWTVNYRTTCEPLIMKVRSGVESTR